jgi:hypothetical protein
MEEEGGDRAEKMKVCLYLGVMKVCLYLGVAYGAVGGFEKAIEYDTQHVALAKELVTRRGKAQHTETSGLRIRSKGTMRRRSNATRRAWRLQRSCATERGKVGRTEIWAIAT